MLRTLPSWSCPAWTAHTTIGTVLLCALLGVCVLPYVFPSEAFIVLAPMALLFVLLAGLVTLEERSGRLARSPWVLLVAAWGWVVLLISVLLFATTHSLLLTLLPATAFFVCAWMLRRTWSVRWWCVAPLRLAGASLDAEDLAWALAGRVYGMGDAPHWPTAIVFALDRFHSPLHVQIEADFLITMGPSIDPRDSVLDLAPRRIRAPSGAHVAPCPDGTSILRIDLPAYPTSAHARLAHIDRVRTATLRMQAAGLVLPPLHPDKDPLYDTRPSAPAAA